MEAKIEAGWLWEVEGMRWGRLFLVVTLVLMLTGTAAARDDGAAKFSDIDGHWAESVLIRLEEEGLLQGYPDGTMRPDDRVTGAQVLVMLGRALDLDPEEEEGEPKDFLALLAQGDRVPSWAVDQVAKGVAGGILAEDEYGSFQPLVPPPRYQVALWLVRTFPVALAELDVTQVLEPFVDAEDVPDRAREAVAYLLEAGVLTGTPDGEIMPLGEITRAQTAALLDRVLDLTAPKTYQGIVEAIDLEQETFALVTDRDYHRFLVTPATSFILDGRRATLSEIPPGTQAQVETLGSTAINFEGESPPVEEVYGVVQTRILGPDPALTVSLEDGVLANFPVSAETELFLDGQKAALEELKPGYWVEVHYQGPATLKVEGERPEGVYDGVVADRTSGSITIAGEDGGEIAFAVGITAEIRLNDQEAKLADLEAGDEVVVIASGLAAERILATTTRMEGVLEAIVRREFHTATIRLDSGTRLTFRVTGDTRILRRGEEVGLVELLQRQVTLDVEGDTIFRIEG